jgi:hypothetical protein
MSLSRKCSRVFPLLLVSISCGGPDVQPTATPGPTAIAISTNCVGPFHPAGHVACSVVVREATPPPSSGVRAFADLRPFGVVFAPDWPIGTCIVCGGPLWTFNLDAYLPPSIEPSRKTFSVSATDAEGRRAETAVSVEITPNPAPTPILVDSKCSGPYRPGDLGFCVVRTVEGASPLSSDLRAFGDLRLFGGSAQRGIPPCTGCGGNTYDLDVRIPADMSPGVKTFPVWVTDAQGRRTDATATLEVIPR